MQGEKILRCAEMCRKFELEHEKVLPFYASSLTAEEQTRDKLKATEPPSEDIAGVDLVPHVKWASVRLCTQPFNLFMTFPP